MRLGAGAAVNESGLAPALLEHIKIAASCEKGRGETGQKFTPYT